MPITYRVLVDPHLRDFFAELHDQDRKYLLQLHKDMKGGTTSIVLSIIITIVLFFYLADS